MQYSALPALRPDLNHTHGAWTDQGADEALPHAGPMDMELGMLIALDECREVL